MVEFFDEMDDEQVDDLLEQNEEDAPRLYEHFPLRCRSRAILVAGRLNSW